MKPPRAQKLGDGSKRRPSQVVLGSVPLKMDLLLCGGASSFLTFIAIAMLLVPNFRSHCLK